MITCHYCGSEEYYTKVVGPHLGAYCSKCGRWIKWLPRKEVKSINNIGSVLPDDIVNNLPDDVSITLPDDLPPW